MAPTRVCSQVMKLIQIIAQARQTAKRISDHSSEVAASSSFLSWFGLGSSDLNSTFCGAEPEESGECVKKTHEFLDRALDNLCQIFKVGIKHSHTVTDAVVLSRASTSVECVCVSSTAEPGPADSAYIQPMLVSGRWQVEAAAGLRPGGERTGPDGPGQEAGQYLCVRPVGLAANTSPTAPPFLLCRS